MLFKSILFLLSASFMPGVCAAAINDLGDTTPITALIDLNALTQTTTTYVASNTSTALNTTLSKRYNFQTAPFKCHGNDFGYAEVDHVVTGIKHLTSSKTNKQKPSNSPMSCGRVSCSNNAAIWWCNLSNNPLTIDSFVDIASGASYVQAKCSIWDDSRGKEMVAGEASPAPDWKVVVRKNSC